MKRNFGISLIAFLMASVLTATALPTMAGRLKSYDGKTGVLVLELEDKSERKFVLSEKTKCEWMGRNTSPGVLPQGAKISIQIAGALNESPLKAAKIVDWGNSETIVAQGAAAPYYTATAQYASTDGGGGVPDGAPTGNRSAHQDMATVGHGGSQNMAQPPAAGQNQNPVSTTSGTSYPTASPSYNNAGSVFYTNQGQSMTAPLENMGIDPYSTNGYPQMGSANDINAAMGLGGDDGDSYNPTPGMETAYGGGQEKFTGQVLQVQLDQGWVLLQAFENPNVMRVLLHDVANAPMQALTPGSMIEVIGSQSPQGFKAREVKAVGGY